MAKKRRIDATKQEIEPETEPEVVPRHTESWPLWIRNEFLRYWYIVGCMFVDAITFLQVYLAPDRPIVLALGLVIILIVIEAFIYRRIWRRKEPKKDEE